MPMVIARRGEEPEFMTEERSPKRVKVEKDQDGDVAMGDDGAAEEEEEELGEVERPPEVGWTSCGIGVRLTGDFE